MGAPVNSWQPIETAPRMRTILLAVPEPCGDPRHWKIASGFWHSGYADESEGDPTPWCFEGRQLRAYEVQPIHWMPLPEPPERPA